MLQFCLSSPVLAWQEGPPRVSEEEWNTIVIPDEGVNPVTIELYAQRDGVLPAIELYGAAAARHASQAGPLTASMLPHGLLLTGLQRLRRFLELW